MIFLQQHSHIILARRGRLSSPLRAAPGCLGPRLFYTTGWGKERQKTGIEYDRNVKMYNKNKTERATPGCLEPPVISLISCIICSTLLIKLYFLRIYLSILRMNLWNNSSILDSVTRPFLHKHLKNLTYELLKNLKYRLPTSERADRNTL